MFYFLKGIITHIDLKKGYIVLDVHDVGYMIFVTHPEHFKLNGEYVVFIYHVIREDEQYLAGFINEDERLAFESLISVKGIGPKTALNAMSATTSEELLQAISANNTTFLKRLPGIGAKAANQIILDLKGQLTGTSEGNPDQYEEVRDALKSLGFKNKVIDEALASINVPDATNEEILRMALKKLKK